MILKATEIGIAIWVYTASVCLSLLTLSSTIMLIIYLWKKEVE